MGCGTSNEGGWSEETWATHVPLLAESFPRRQAENLDLLRGGKQTFAKMASIMRAAKEEILVSGWALNPFVHLIRDEEKGLQEEDRFSAIVLAKAKEGVKVRIIVWDETDIGLATHRSLIVKERLENLHPNIKVLRVSRNDLTSSFHMKMVVSDRKILVCGGLDIMINRYDDTYELFDDKGVKHPGIDFSSITINGGKPSLIDYETPDKDFLDRTKYQRLPWQDIAITVSGLAANDLADVFVMTWNDGMANVFRGGVKGEDFKMKSRPTIEAVPNPVGGDDNPTGGDGNCQIVTNLPKWLISDETLPVGMSRTSIYQAWINAVRSAEHYIYIEQQYIQGAIQGFGGTENLILTEVFEKLMTVIKDPTRVFKVFFVIPEPYFNDGIVNIAKQSIVRRIMESLFREKGLYTKLTEALTAMKSPKTADDYIAINCLRKWVDRPGRGPITGGIFVHSKVILVDDRVCVVGSPNLNDRSFSGQTDAEAGLAVWESATVQGMMNGKEVMVGKAVQAFRQELMSIYLGVPAESVLDPTSPAFFDDMWQKTAKTNTDIFEKVFSNFPSNALRTEEAYNAAMTKELVHQPELLEGVRGLLTQCPCFFLADDEPNFAEKISDALEIIALR